MEEYKFELEKGIPVPPITSARLGLLKYPFDKLEVGDSFSIKLNEKQSYKKTAMKICAAAGYYGKKFKPKKLYTIRLCSDCVRCWRIR